MSVPIPPEMLDLFDEPALGHLAYTTDAGQVVSFPLWIDHDGSHLLASSPLGSKKGQAMRKHPQVGISIVSTKTPWHWISASGRVVEIRPDEGLAFINRMSHKYLGQAYQRPGPREVFVIEIDRVGHSGTWGG
jgi:nitroimidazol reductase NimA-like FMN-containing flavoprotein (pyridoxamine 5'-phosphate oxidase superfamily)